MRARWKHDWERVATLEAAVAAGFHPLDAVRKCKNCGAAQKRESTYNGEYGRRGPKVTGYVWRPKVERCRFVPVPTPA